MCMGEKAEKTQNKTSSGSREINVSDVHVSDVKCFIESILQGLRQSGFYWRGLSKDKADFLLKKSSIGTFLVRDSAHPMYLFTLTVRTLNGVTNIRIAMENRRFSLESYNQDKSKVEHFANVLQLITYYVYISKQTRNTATSNITVKKNELYLEKPFYKYVCSLQHISRRTVHRCLPRGGIYQLPIPDMARVYLSQHPYPV